MITEPKIETNIDETGRVITLNDTTTSWGGGGVYKSDIYSVEITVSNYCSKEVMSTEQNRVFPNPQLPEVVDILNGEDVLLTASNFGLPEAVAFTDGVIDVNMYYKDRTDYNLQLFKGNIYIETPLADELLAKYLYLESEGVRYILDQTKNTNGGTILYLTEEIQNNSSEAVFVIRANDKVLNSTTVDRKFYTGIGRASSRCGCNGKYKLLDMQFNLMGSKLYFNRGDFKKSQDLIVEAEMMAKYLDCNNCR